MLIFTWLPRGRAEECHPGCPDIWIGDKWCDKACLVEACGFDHGDCDHHEDSWEAEHQDSWEPEHHQDSAEHQDSWEPEHHQDSWEPEHHKDSWEPEHHQDSWEPDHHQDSAEHHHDSWEPDHQDSAEHHHDSLETDHHQDSWEPEHHDSWDEHQDAWEPEHHQNSLEPEHEPEVVVEHQDSWEAEEPEVVVEHQASWDEYEEALAAHQAWEAEEALAAHQAWEAEEALAEEVVVEHQDSWGAEHEDAKVEPEAELVEQIPEAEVVMPEAELEQIEEALETEVDLPILTEDEAWEPEMDEAWEAENEAWEAEMEDASSWEESGENCHPGCPAEWVGDGWCDEACLVEACSFDRGDCDEPTPTTAAPTAGPTDCDPLIDEYGCWVPPPPITDVQEEEWLMVNRKWDLWRECGENGCWTVFPPLTPVKITAPQPPRTGPSKTARHDPLTHGDAYEDLMVWYHDYGAQLESLIPVKCVDDQTCEAPGEQITRPGAQQWQTLVQGERRTLTISLILMHFADFGNVEITPELQETIVSRFTHPSIGEFINSQILNGQEVELKINFKGWVSSELREFTIGEQQSSKNGEVAQSADPNWAAFFPDRPTRWCTDFDQNFLSHDAKHSLDGIEDLDWHPENDLVTLVVPVLRSCVASAFFNIMPYLYHGELKNARIAMMAFNLPTFMGGNRCFWEACSDDGWDSPGPPYNGQGALETWKNPIQGTSRTLIHELMHSFGIGYHAGRYNCPEHFGDAGSSPSCGSTDYGSTISAIGTGMGYAMELSPNERYHLHFMDRAEFLFIHESGSFTIAPINKASGPTALKRAAVIVHEKYSFFVEFRQGVGFDTIIGQSDETKMNNNADGIILSHNNKLIPIHGWSDDNTDGDGHVLQWSLNAGESFNLWDTGVTLSGVQSCGEFVTFFVSYEGTVAVPSVPAC